MSPFFDPPPSARPDESRYLPLLDKLNYRDSGVVNFYRVIGVLIMLGGLVAMLFIHGLVKEGYPDGNFVLSAIGWYVGIGGIITGIGWIAVAQLIAGQERILAALLKDR